MDKYQPDKDVEKELKKERIAHDLGVLESEHKDEYEAWRSKLHNLFHATEDTATLAAVNLFDVNELRRCASLLSSTVLTC